MEGSEHFVLSSTGGEGGGTGGECEVYPEWYCWGQDLIGCLGVLSTTDL